MEHLDKYLLHTKYSITVFVIMLSFPFRTHCVRSEKAHVCPLWPKDLENGARVLSRIMSCKLFSRGASQQFHLLTIRTWQVLHLILQMSSLYCFSLWAGNYLRAETITYSSIQSYYTVGTAQSIHMDQIMWFVQKSCEETRAQRG